MNSFVLSAYWNSGRHAIDQIGGHAQRLDLSATHDFVGDGPRPALVAVLEQHLLDGEGSHAIEHG